MARKPMKPKYVQALRNVGIDVSSRKSLKQLQRMWQGWRNDFVSTHDAKAPTLYQAMELDKLTSYLNQFRTDELDYEQTERDANMQTAPTQYNEGEYLVKDFEDKVTATYERTMAEIDRAMTHSTHDDGQLGALSNPYRAIITEQYNMIMNALELLKESGAPLSMIGQAIANNVEYDYMLAVEMGGPSDINFLWEKTIEGLKAVMEQINNEAKRLAEEEERKLTGQ